MNENIYILSIEMVLLKKKAEMNKGKKAKRNCLEKS